MNIQKVKKKTIPSSQRLKKRYVLIEILPEKILEKDFYFGFWIDLLSFFGSKGVAEIMPKLVFYKDNKVVLKCKRGKEKELIAGLGFIKKIRNKKVILVPLKSSGSIKKIKSDFNL